MSDTRLMGLVAGLIYACAVTGDGYAAGESGIPGLTSIDRP